MRSKGPQHLSDEQLAQFEDGELSERDARHIASCPDCTNRIRDLQAVRSAYGLYWHSVRQPKLPAPPKDWEPIDALVARNRSRQRRRSFRLRILLGVAAAICVVAFVVFHKRTQSPSLRMNALLTRSGKAELPAEMSIAIHVHGRTVLRPAVLRSSSVARTDPDLAHLKALFREADYNWREPLSSRSFQNWRHHLKRKRDFVSVVWERGDKRAYRIRTETPTGILRSAALTLRAEDLRPTSGAFDFEKEGSVELTETNVPAPHTAERSHPPVKTKSPEIPASPVDTLHVLAALDRIGADVGEPIEISEGPRHRSVIVRGMGLSPKQEQEIRRVLQPIPRTRFEAGSASATPFPVQSGTAGQYASGVPPALLRRFEQQMGGGVAFQATTDRVLDASSSALARVHALEVLAQNFPPDIQARLSSKNQRLLRTLRLKHVAALQGLMRQIQAELKPILPASGNTPLHSRSAAENTESWQAGIPSLVTAIRKLDKSLSVLLAGSYSQSSGAALMRAVPGQIEAVDSGIRFQRRNTK